MLRGPDAGAAPRVAFEVDSYDRARPLVIDPILFYSSFLGNHGNGFISGVAEDSAGNAYRTFLGREPDPVGLAAWEGILRNALLDVIELGFVPSPEFQGLIPQVCG